MMRLKNTAAVLVLDFITSDSCVISSRFIPTGLKINTVEYFMILKEVVMPWVPSNYDAN